MSDRRPRTGRLQMTPTEGKKHIKRLLGPKGTWTDNRVASSPEEREHYKGESVTRKAEYETLKAERDEMHRKLPADPAYQALVQRTKAARESWERAQGFTHYYRLSAGKIEPGMFNMIEAHGDNWAELIRNIEAKQKSA